MLGAPVRDRSCYFGAPPQTDLLSPPPRTGFVANMEVGFLNLSLILSLTLTLQVISQLFCPSPRNTTFNRTALEASFNKEFRHCWLVKTCPRVELTLSSCRPFEDLYAWDELGKTVAQVQMIPMKELKLALAESLCAAREVVDCTASSHAAAWAWCIVIVVTLIWLYSGGSRKLLSCWRTALK